LIIHNKHIPIHIIHHDELASTNSEAKNIAEVGGSNWTVVVADKQNAGRGRNGSTWESKKDLGLWFSIIIYPNIETKDYFKVNFLTVLLLGDFLIHQLNSILAKETFQIQFKWPNDIFLNNKKLCGILLESSTSIESKRFLIVGIGLNVNHLISDFSTAIRSSAISLRMVTKSEWNLSDLLLNFLEYYYFNFNKYLENNFNEVLKIYQSRMMFLNQRIKLKINSDTVEGIVRGITCEGFLKLEVNKMERVLKTSDIWYL
jgi:BirA family biotin operon repressor/biotin-[acetyl-CoA-carboxylase] ligase